MKEILAKIENKLNEFNSFKKINPHVHWKNLIYIFFILIIILILFSFYLLFEIKNQQVFKVVSPATESPNLMNEALLKKVTKSFDDKLIKQKEIQDGLYSYKDPSLN